MEKILSKIIKDKDAIYNILQDVIDDPNIDDEEKDFLISLSDVDLFDQEAIERKNSKKNEVSKRKNP